MRLDKMQLLMQSFVPLAINSEARGGMTFMRRLHFGLLSLVLAVAAEPLVATTYYVGTCKTGAFGTISAAVATVPAGSIIDVCPGSYAEQVIISKGLTLQGILSNNSSQAVITVPSGGLPTTASSILFGLVTPQVEVTAGPVTLTNITVDGSASGNDCPSTPYIGIFYASGSSGTVNEVETRNQNCSNAGNFGLGILAENGAGTTQSVTIENSNINNSSGFGISACSDQTPSTLMASIKSNYVAAINDYGIYMACNTGGSVSGNIIVPLVGYGVVAGSPSSSISKNTVNGAVNSGIFITDTAGAVVVSGNTINGANTGISVSSAGSVTANNILGGSYGINLGVSGATIKSNIITQAPVGIEFNCFSGDTVSGNTINGATTGTDQVPAAFSGANKFYNVGTVRVGGAC
jgi:hypothetical protein